MRKMTEEKVVESETAWMKIEELSVVDKVILGVVCNSSNYWRPVDKNNPTPDEFLTVLGILRECGGCVPDEDLGDDLSVAIIEKYYRYWNMVREYIAIYVERNVDSIRLCIMPSFDDRTHVVVFDESTARVLMYHDSKAWNFCITDAKDLIDRVREDALIIEERIVHGEKLKKLAEKAGIGVAEL